MSIFNRRVQKKILSAFGKGDYRALSRGLAYFSLRFAGQLLALPAVAVLWILRPLAWVKIGKLCHTRLGHLALNTDLFVRRLNLKKYPDTSVYFFVCDSRGAANKQLLTMFKRVLRIYESRALAAMFDGMFPVLGRTPFYQPLTMNSNEFYEFTNTNATLSFTEDEIEKGRKLLKEMCAE